jgi:DNA-binding IclR family transcriptional regulator
VLSELAAAGSEGTTTGAIARAMEYDLPNADSTLCALANQGLVDKDTSVDPHVYRLSPALLGGAAGGRQPDD